MDIVYVHNPNRHTELHAATCKATTRRPRGTYHANEVSAPTTAADIQAGWLKYADEPACRVHACCKDEFSPEYLKGQKPGQEAF